jgi:hypothetical protein
MAAHSTGTLDAALDDARRMGLGDDDTMAHLAQALAGESGFSRDRATTAAQAYLRKK